MHLPSTTPITQHLQRAPTFALLNWSDRENGSEARTKAANLHRAITLLQLTWSLSQTKQRHLRLTGWKINPTTSLKKQ